MLELRLHAEGSFAKKEWICPVKWERRQTKQLIDTLSVLQSDNHQE